MSSKLRPSELVAGLVLKALAARNPCLGSLVIKRPSGAILIVAMLWDAKTKMRLKMHWLNSYLLLNKLK